MCLFSGASCCRLPWWCLHWLPHGIPTYGAWNYPRVAFPAPTLLFLFSNQSSCVFKIISFAFLLNKSDFKRSTTHQSHVIQVSAVRLYTTYKNKWVPVDYHCTNLLTHGSCLRTWPLMKDIWSCWMFLSWKPIYFLAQVVQRHIFFVLFTSHLMICICSLCLIVVFRWFTGALYFSLAIILALAIFEEPEVIVC